MLRAACTAVIALAVSTAAADQITAEYLGPGDGLAGSAGERNRFGQSFLTTVGGDVSEVDLRMRRNGAQPATVIVTMFETDSQGLPAAELGSANLPVTLTPDFEWYTVDFAGAGVTLDAGVTYAFMVSSISGDGGYLLETARPGGYFDGQGLVTIAGGPIEPMADNFIYGDRDVLFVVRVGDDTCLADLSSPADPGVPDGVLTGADFFEFLDRFQAGDLSVDFSGPTNPGVPDGVLTGADFFEFLDLFAQGC